MPDRLDQVRVAIDQELARIIDHLAGRGPEHAHPLIGRVYRWMRHYLANDGKRMHGIAVVLAHRACGGKLDQAILPVAAAMQLYHHHTLVHDDIYDEDHTRRGWPTAHAAFAGWFEKQAGQDEPSTVFAGKGMRRGVITAFAYGKICRAVAGSAMLAAPFPAEALLAVNADLEWHDLFDNAAQLKDVCHEGDPLFDSRSCLDNAWLKTGRLFEVCAAAGARLAGARPQQVAALKLWAGQSALAYQLQDDLEDLQIESEKGQGRGVGSDLLRCKPTYLYALAKTRARGADQQALLRWQAGEKDGLDTAAIIAILQRCGALEDCRSEVEHCLVLAAQALAEAGFSAAVRADMDAFSRYFVSPGYWRRQIDKDTTRGAALIA